MGNIYYEFTALLLISALVGAIAVRLRQPLIVAFIFVGILVGPAALGLVRSHDEIALLAQIGVTVLLFVVGLKLDLHLIRHIGPVALATGLGQIGFTIVFGYLIGLGFGMDHTKAIYIAIALAFSSTIIIVKLLSDKREIDSLHGRIAMGILIVQDIAVVIAMMTVGSLHGEMDTGIGFTFLTIIGRLAAAAIFVAVFMRLVFPYLLGSLARSQELLLLFGIAWGTALASAGELLGFSKEVGAFLAGFSLASPPYPEAISARLTSLRDFLLLFFFIDLGSRIYLSTLGAEVYTAVVFSLFVLIGKPLIVMAIMAYLGYRKRTGFMTGLTLAQISEFSIIFMAMSISLGHIEQETLGLVTLVGLVTITLSTYMILYSQPLYEWLVPWLSVFERSDPFRERAVEKGRRTGEEAEVIIFGVGRYGGRLVLRLQERGLAVLGVDFDPENVRAMRRKGIPMRFGDAEDLDFPESLPLENVRWVISTLPHPDVNLTLMRALANQDYTGKVAVTAHNEPEGHMLEKAGAHHVLYPFMDAAEFAAEVIAGENKT